MKWSDVTRDKRYQSASPELQERIRNDFFENVIAADIPDGTDRLSIRREFDRRTDPLANDKPTFLGSLKDKAIEYGNDALDAANEFAPKLRENALRMAMPGVAAVGEGIGVAAPDGVPDEATQVYDSVKSGLKQAAAGTKVLWNTFGEDDVDDIAAGLNNYKAAIQEQVVTEKDKQFRASMQANSAQVNDAQGILPTLAELSDYARIVASNKLPAFKMGAQAMTQSIPGIAGGLLARAPGAAAGAMVGGPVGAIVGGTATGIAGGTASNYSIEAAPNVFESLVDKYGDQVWGWGDKEIAAALRESPDVIDSGLSTALKRSAAIAAVQVPVLKLAGKVATIPTSTIKGLVAKGATAGALSGASEAGGELAAQVAAGQPIDTAEAVYELTGGVAAAPVTVTMAAREFAKNARDIRQQQTPVIPANPAAPASQEVASQQVADDQLLQQLNKQYQAEAQQQQADIALQSISSAQNADEAIGLFTQATNIPITINAGPAFNAQSMGLLGLGNQYANTNGQDVAAELAGNSGIAQPDNAVGGVADISVQPDAGSNRGRTDNTPQAFAQSGGNGLLMGNGANWGSAVSAEQRNVINADAGIGFNAENTLKGEANGRQVQGQETAQEVKTFANATEGDIVESGGVKFRKVGNGFERVNETLSPESLVSTEQSKVSTPELSSSADGIVKKATPANASIQSAPAGGTYSGVTADWQGNAWDGKPTIGEGEKVDNAVRPGDIGTGKANAPFQGRGAAISKMMRDNLIDTHEIVHVGKNAVVLRPIKQAQSSDLNATTTPQAAQNKASEPVGSVQSDGESRNEAIRPIVEAIAKRRAVAEGQLGKAKAYGRVLEAGKRLLNGESVNVGDLKIAANELKADKELHAQAMKLVEIASQSAKQARKEAKGAVKSYRERIAKAKSSEELRAIANEVRHDTVLSDAQAQQLDGEALKAEDALTKTADQQGVDKERLANHKETLRAWLPDFDWAERGGRIIRNEKGAVSGRTPWVPKVQEFRDILDGVKSDYPQASFAKMRQAVNKALIGGKLNGMDARFVNALLDFAESVSFEDVPAEVADAANSVMADVSQSDDWLDAFGSVTNEAEFERAMGYGTEQGNESETGQAATAETQAGDATGVQEAQGEGKAGQGNGRNEVNLLSTYTNQEVLDREQQTAARESAANEAERKAEDARREAQVDKERQSRAGIAADAFTLTPTASTAADTKKADEKTANDQFAGQGGLFAANPAGNGPGNEITHNGVRIYKTRISQRGEMWAVETADNKAKREAGERTIGGDTLHGTLDEAKRAADAMVEAEKRDAESQRAEEARNAERKAQEEARKADDYNGFLSDKSDLQKGLIRKTLDKQVRINGNATTIRDYVEQNAKAGTLEASTMEEPKIKPMSRTQFNRADNRQQAEHERKMKEAGNKTTYLVNGYELGRFAHDYAKHLLANKPGNETDFVTKTGDAAQAAKPTPQYKAGDRVIPSKDVFEGDIVRTDDGKLWMAKVKRGHNIPVFPFENGKPSVSADTRRLIDLDVTEVTHTGTNYYGYGEQPKPTAQPSEQVKAEPAEAKEAEGEKKIADSGEKKETDKGVALFSRSYAGEDDIDDSDTRIVSRNMSEKSAAITRAAHKVASQKNPADKARVRGYYDRMLGLPSRESEYSKISIISYQQGVKRADNQRALLKGKTWFESDIEKDGSKWKWAVYAEGMYVASGTAASETKAYDATIDARVNYAALYSRSVGVHGNGIAMRDAEAVIDRLSRGYNNLPPILLFAKPSQLKGTHDELLADINKARATADVEAAFHEGKIYVFIDNLSSTDRLEHVLFNHEVGHYGLRGVFGQDLDPMLDYVLKHSIKLQLETTKKQRTLGIKSRIEALEEVIVDMKPEELVKLKGWHKVAMFIRNWLESHGFTNLANRVNDYLTSKVGEDQAIDMMVADMITKARNWAKNGKRSGSTDIYLGVTRLSDVRESWYYSQLEKGIEGAKQESMPAAQWKLWLASNAGKMGIKQDEIQWTGINEYLDLQGKGKVSKADILNYLAQNGVQVQETMLGNIDESDVELWWNDEGGANEETPYSELSDAERNDAIQRYREEVAQYADGATKYATYKVQGGENYRELLLTLPVKDASNKFEVRPKGSGFGVWDTVFNKWESATLNKDVADDVASRKNSEDDKWHGKIFQSGHFDQKNILAHVRFDERTDADGQRVLFLHEIQSDFAQEKRQGKHEIAAPFIDDTKAWVSLALKRMIAYAASNGFDKVAIISGQQAADLYDLSKQINMASAIANADGTYSLIVEDKGGNEIAPYSRGGKKVTPAEMEDVVGKELSKKLIDGADKVKGKPWPKNAKVNPAFFTVSGIDLKIGGEGMRAFYDQIVPQVANDVLKKVGGGKVESIVMEKGGMRPHPDGMDVEVAAEIQTGFTITPAMREKVASGLPLFSKKEGKFNDAFWKWFGDSKVVDDNGMPIVVYHGTGADFSVFSEARHRSELNNKYQGDGFHFSESPQVASRYAFADRNNMLRKEDIYPVVDAKFPGRVSSIFKSVVENGYDKAWDLSDSEVDAIIQESRDLGIDINDLLDLASVVEGSRYYDKRDSGIDPSDLFAAIFGGGSNSLLSEYHVNDMVSMGIDSAAPKHNVMPVYLKIDKLLRTDNREEARMARANGYDGVYYYGEDLVGGEPEWVVFSPEQIKSAIGNKGQWDANNPDIRYSRKPSENDSVVPAETKAQAAQRVVQDQFNRFKVLNEWLNKQGFDFSDSEDVYLNETQYHGRVAARKEDFRETVMKPLIEKTQKAGFTIEQVADFLMAQHAPEANKRQRDIHQDDEATAYGITDDEARQAMDEFKKLDNFAELKAIASEWRGITEQTKKILLDSGLRSKEEVAAWEAAYDFYIPVKGDEQKTGTGKGLHVNAKHYRRLGHEKRDEAVIENILSDHERAIALDEKNRVGKALIRWAVKINNPDIITVGKPEKRQVLRNGESRYVVQYKGKDVVVAETEAEARYYITAETAAGKTRSDFVIEKTTDPARVILQASPMLADNEVTVYVGGNAVRVQINDEIAARAYKRLGVEHLNSLLGAGRIVNNWLSKVYTGYSPDFIFTNMLRDATQGLMTLTGEYGITTAAKVFANYRFAVNELIRHFRHHGSSDLVADYRAHGGAVGAAYLSDLERIGNDVMSAYDEYAGVMNTYKRVYDGEIESGSSAARAQTKAMLKSGLAGAKRIPAVGHLLRFIERINAMTENALRVATYKTLVDSGVSKNRAAAQAKNLMNFNRKGEISNQAGALYLFFNPGVQGSQVMYRALFDSKHKKQVQSLVGMMVLNAIAISMLNASGDDDDKKRWDETKDSVKDGNLVFTIGGTNVTITLPYGYRLFHMLGNVIYDYMDGKNPDKLGIRLANGVFENLSPLGNPMNGGVFQMFPTAAKMAAGPGVNQDSRGNKIGPKRWNDYIPDSQLMNRSTRGSFYDSAADFLNDASGGNDYQKGYVDVSPETLKFWVRSLTGGAGQAAFDAVGFAKNLYDGVDTKTKNMPIIRRFVADDPMDGKRDAFYEAMNDVKQSAAEFNAAKKAHDTVAMREMLAEDGPLIRLSHLANNMKKMADAKRDAIVDVKSNDKLTPSEKMLKIEQYEKSEAKAYDVFLNEFERASKRAANQ